MATVFNIILAVVCVAGAAGLTEAKSAAVRKPRCNSRNFFLGRFISTPSEDTQVNMRNPAAADQRASITITELKKGPNAIYRYSESSGKSKSVDVSFTFRLNKMGAYVNHGVRTRYNVVLKGKDLLLNFFPAGRQPYSYKLRFGNDPCKGGVHMVVTQKGQKQGHRSYKQRLYV